MTTQSFFHPVIYTTPINLVSESEKNSSIQILIPTIYGLVYQVVDQIKAKNFPTDTFKLTGVLRIGMTGKSGFYLLVNLNNMRCYLGETCHLTRRRANYMFGFREAMKGKSSRAIVATLRKEIFDNTATITDFLWIPLLVMPSGLYCFKNKEATPEKTVKKLQNEEKTSFLCEIKSSVLTKLFEEQKISLYNIQTGSTFVEGNKFGGSKNSGDPAKPIKIGKFAFESISCAAQALGVDRKTIRLAKEKFVFELTPKVWLQWEPSKKVTSENSAEFRTKSPNFYTETKKIG